MKENDVKCDFEEIMDFQKFEKFFKKEIYKLLHGRYYINDNEFDDYENLIYAFANDSWKYIDVDNYLAYDIFEYLLLNIGNLDVYDSRNKKKKKYSYLFNKFSEVLKDEKVFSKFVNFLKENYINENSCFYFCDNDNLLGLLCENISFKWQAELLLKTLNKLYNDRNI